MELLPYWFIEFEMNLNLKKLQKNPIFSSILKFWGLIFKFYHSKNMNKKLKFNHNAQCII